VELRKALERSGVCRGSGNADVAAKRGIAESRTKVSTMLRTVYLACRATEEKVGLKIKRVRSLDMLMCVEVNSNSLATLRNHRFRAST
jgi:hypothetical protein